jgi:hypothetical protein
MGLPLMTHNKLTDPDHSSKKLNAATQNPEYPIMAGPGGYVVAGNCGCIATGIANAAGDPGMRS